MTANVTLFVGFGTSAFLSLSKGKPTWRGLGENVHIDPNATKRKLIVASIITDVHGAICAGYHSVDRSPAARMQFPTFFG